MNVLLVAGTALSAISDVTKCAYLCEGDCDFMAVGKDAVVYPLNWKYVAAGEVEDIPLIHSRSEALIISYQRFPYVDIVEPRESWEGGSSALLGTLAALNVGYTKIVLCGVPLQGDNPNHPGARYEMFQAKWLSCEKTLLPFVRSMSGWTAEVFGAPSKRWING